MSMRKWLGMSAVFALVTVGAPQPVSADWVLTPFVGANFKGSADVNGTGGSSLSNKFEKKIDYGASAAWMGAGAVGFEVDFGYSPNFFEGGTAGNNSFEFTNDSNVTTLTGNAIIGIPIGGSRGGSVRPYLVGGVGLIRTNVQDASELFDVSTKNDFGFDVGGGVMGFFTTNVGIRGDVRYFRSFSGSSDNVTGLGVSEFSFWRGSVGLAFKF
jgi:opacity protein-like surface antigen